MSAAQIQTLETSRSQNPLKRYVSCVHVLPYHIQIGTRLETLTLVDVIAQPKQSRRAKKQGQQNSSTSG